MQRTAPDTDENDSTPPATRALRRAFGTEGVTITLSPRTIALVLGIWLAFWVVRELTSTLLVFAVAILLASVVDRPVAALQNLGVPRRLGILLVFALMLGILAALVAVLIPLISTEVTALEKNLASYQTQLTDTLARYHIRLPATNTDAMFQRLSDNLSQVADQAATIGLGRADGNGHLRDVRHGGSAGGVADDRHGFAARSCPRNQHSG